MNHLTESTRTATEQRFAYKVRQALNEAADALPANQLERLAAARKAALQVQKREPKRAEQWAMSPALLGHGNTAMAGGPLSKGKLALVFAALLLTVAGVVSLFHVEQQRLIEETAEVETGVLVDELPISTYADHGFNAFLKQNP